MISMSYYLSGGSFSRLSFIIIVIVIIIMTIIIHLDILMVHKNTIRMLLPWGYVALIHIHQISFVNRSKVDRNSWLDKVDL